MRFFWKAPLSKTVRILDDVKGHELYFFGVTVGWLGFGFLLGLKRQPTTYAPDDATVSRGGSTLTDDRIYSNSATGATPHRR